MGKTQAINQKIENCQITNSLIFQSSSDNVDLSELLSALNNLELLNGLTNEKLSNCYKYILEDKYGTAEKIINSFFDHGLKGINALNTKKIYYYSCIICLLKREEVPEVYKQHLEKNELDNLEYIVDITNNPVLLESNYYYCDTIARYAIVFLLFQLGEYNSITRFYRNCELEEEFEIYYYSISCYNTLDFNECQTAINKLPYNNNPKYEFIKLLISAAILVNTITPKTVNYPYDLKRIDTLSMSIKKFKSTHQDIIKSNQIVFAQAELSVIAIIEPNEFLSVYQQLPKRIKDYYGLKMIKALFYEREGDIQNALLLFIELFDEKKTPEILYKIMLSHLSLYQEEEVLNVFINNKEIVKGDIASNIVGLYLDALKRINVSKFEEEFEAFLPETNDDINYVFSLSISAIGNEHSEKAIYPIIVAHKDEVLTMQSLMKSSVAIVVMHIGDTEFAEEIFASINEKLTPNIANEISNSIVDLPANTQERILNCLIKNGYETENVLKHKCNVLVELNKLVAATECLKKVFEIEPSCNTAFKIVQILNQRNISDESEYKDYLPFLEEQADPKCCILLAQTYFIIGKYELVDDYAFKSLLFSDDYQTVDNYIRMHLNALKIHYDIKEFDTVMDNTVVVLRNPDNGNVYNICLNSDSYNMVHPLDAIGATHYSKDSAFYFQILAKKREDYIVYKDEKCVITDIINKHTYAIQFAYKKLFGDYESETSFKKILIDPDEDIEKQLTQYIDTEQSDFVDKYLNRENGFYWPIEIVASGYNYYSEVIKDLLLTDNSIFYAGLYRPLSISGNKKIVLTLSTLVVLAHFNMLDLIVAQKEKILVPRSLIYLITEILQKKSENNIVSPGSLIKHDEKVFLLKNDESQTDFWAIILDVAKKFTIVDVSDKTRVEFDCSNTSLESVFSHLNVDIYMLDCFILSKDNNAVLLCDDACFGIFNGLINYNIQNFTSLLALVDDTTKYEEYIERIAKSNYTYFPFWLVKDKDYHKILSTVCNSEIKKKYYLEMARLVFCN